MTIRVMHMGDYDSVFALWSATSGMGMRSLDDSCEGIARFLLRNPSTCFVAEEDGAPVGVILCGHDGRRGYIYHTAVAKSARGHGIGRALVEAVKSALIDEGINKVALVAFASNEGGNNFWERLGFTARGDLVYRNLTLNEDNR